MQRLRLQLPLAGISRTALATPDFNGEAIGSVLAVMLSRRRESYHTLYSLRADP